MSGTSSGRPPSKRRRGEDDSQDGGQDDGLPGIQVSGTASDLALFLWQRPVTGRLDVRITPTRISGRRL